MILTFVIPPLIYSAALKSSLLAIRKDLRVVISLSIGLVLATALVVGGALTCLSPGWAWRLAPPWALLLPRPTRWPRWRSRGRAGLPSRLITIIEGGELSRRRS